MSKYLALIICVLCISAGQVLFKMSANNMRETAIWGLFFDPIFIAGVVLYGLTTLGWVWCLQDVPLNRAYLFMSLAYIIVPVLGLLFFKEVLTFRYFLSVALIVSGILCSIW
jgi:drug/metabolite transporter (DMT)-like permease